MKKTIPALALAAATILALSSCGGEKKKAEKQDRNQSDTVMTDKRWTKSDPMALTLNPVTNFAQNWMALSVGTAKNFNSMTVSWGTIGYLWNKPVVMVFVSSDRATKRLMDNNEYFSLVGFPDTRESREALEYIGTHSMKDDPGKIVNAGLTIEFTELGTPVIAQGKMAFECRKLYSEPFDIEKIPADIREKMYAETGIHTMYVGEIVNVLEKK